MLISSQQFSPTQSMFGETFQIFHYCDSKPINTDVHYHDYYEVCCFISGDIEYWIEGRIYRPKPGDILLINPSELHRHIVNKQTHTYERIVLWIKKEYLEGLKFDIPLVDCFNNKNFEITRHIKPAPIMRTDIISKLSELSNEFYSDEYGSKLCAYSIFLRFMVELNRLALLIGENREEESEQPSLVIEVLQYISDHYSEELSLDALSQKFFVSKYHLSHEFSNTVGTSIYRYILLKRLLAARQLLLSGVTPSEAALRCGFKDYTSFFRAFKGEYGISPRACCTTGNRE